MSALALHLDTHRDRLGIKGARAAEWLVAHGMPVPTAPNTWTCSAETPAAGAVLVARLGNSEFFLEDAAAGNTLQRMAPALGERPRGVYPVLREDWAFRLGGGQADEVLAQVCNVNFAALPLASRPLIMTLMIGVAVLVVPQSVTGAASAAGAPNAASAPYLASAPTAAGAPGGGFDPTFGPYLGESLGAVVIECGGTYTGVSG
jgi:hypothetical protein